MIDCGGCSLDADWYAIKKEFDTAFNPIKDKGLAVKESFSLDDVCMVILEINEKNLKKKIRNYLTNHCHVYAPGSHHK